MKAISRIILIITLVQGSTSAFSQNEANSVNAASKLLNSEKNLTIGGYGQIDYNQPMGDNKIQNGTLDVHRLVLLFGYRFNDRLNFVSEIEIEHVNEVYVEQAFLNYSLNTYLQFRGGLMLVPMGIINEYHEPTTFNGVERPLIDKYIAPTTWREIGFGITGTIPEVSMRYQAYLMNGFSSYNGSAQLSGKNGMRSGRQKGAKSYIRTPVFAGRVEYFGVLGLNLGLSAYVGETQSSLYKEVDKDDDLAINTADSSIVNMSMIGVDARYQVKGFQFRGQLYYTKLNNTMQYNYITSVDNKPNDLGNSMYGYYLEGGYNIFQTSGKIKSDLIPFIRYSAYDTQNTVVDGFEKNNSYATEVITTGIAWKPISEVAVKADLQFNKSKSDDNYSKVFNAGIAIWF
jgi:hypothetical protein